MKHILDAGPLIAALNRDDRYHRWACSTLDRLGPPFCSCPEALAEAAAMTGQAAAIVEMVRAGEIVLTFDLSAQAASVLALLNVSGGQEARESDVWSRPERSAASFSATSGLILSAR